MRVRSITVSLALGLMVFVSLPAQAQIYKCSDADGHITYSNISARGCTKMNLEPIYSVPGSKSGGRSASPTPSSFPRVEENTQKARDSDRRKILDQEMTAETKNLEEAKQRLTEAEAVQPQDRIQGGAINHGKVQERTTPLRDQVQLHERNIDAIRKEIQNLR